MIEGEKEKVRELCAGDGGGGRGGGGGVLFLFLFLGGAIRLDAGGAVDVCISSPGAVF